MKEKCPCGSNLEASSCCISIIKGERPAATAEQLMRSRYTAFTLSNADYLIKTHHHSSRNIMDVLESVNYLKKADWQGLEIKKTKKGDKYSTSGKVEFIASYILDGQLERIHELSDFINEDGQWYYTKGVHF
ncbi:MAG: YchJ family metal-binding protein [Marinifilaceae bacterium]|jgi:SEC-C motif-containing protein|nr:YchJ family metal-binding protein [Marinifilaceae bacterium]